MIPYSQPSIDDSDFESVKNVLRSTWLAGDGQKSKEFEDRLGEYIKSRIVEKNPYVTAFNSGTSALDIAIRSLEIPFGSEVITTPFTFVATSHAILANNLKPIFIDIEEDTRNIDVRKIQEKITDKTKAIIFVDYAGHPCDLRELHKLSFDYNFHMIEDAAHSLGAEYYGKKVGNLADLTMFSFHAVKLITTGEGGAIATYNTTLNRKMKLIRRLGVDKSPIERLGWKYDVLKLGGNYRLSDLQAALGISQLSKIDKLLVKREYIANRYNEAFEDLKQIETPIAKNYVKHAWHLYTILVDNRDRFFNNMRKEGIGVNVHFIPIYRFSYYKKLFNINPKRFPITEKVYNKIISLPIYPNMSEVDIDRVIDAVKKSL